MAGILPEKHRFGTGRLARVLIDLLPKVKALRVQGSFEFDCTLGVLLGPDRALPSLARKPSRHADELNDEPGRCSGMIRSVRRASLKGDFLADIAKELLPPRRKPDGPLFGGTIKKCAELGPGLRRDPEIKLPEMAGGAPTIP